jgi:homocysteine S-methyltransferase
LKRADFADLVSQRVLVFDGAMGTMLYQRGIFVNRCFDELNVTDPGLVAGVHKSYVDAGVDLIETNTFGANRLKLAKYGLTGEVRAFNRAGVETAREAAGEGVLVAGAIGPLGAEITEFGPLSREAAAEMFREQGVALLEAGVDLLILETFSSSEELLVAIRAVSPLRDTPIIAQMTVNTGNETPYGERIEQAMGRIAAESGVSVVGLNCSVGPSDMLSSLDRIRTVTDKPISVQPNAGMPRQVEGRQLYMSTPEYMAEYAKRFFEKGARIIGGCCGTTPEHIGEIVRVIRSVDRAATRVSVAPAAPTAAAAEPALKEPVPLAEKSRFGAKLVAGEQVASIEMTPPRGVNMSAILERARICAAAGVDAINIPDGPRASSRLSPMVTAVRIQQEVGIEAILHFCCRDRNLIGMQSDILGAAAIGLENLLIVTGDPPKLGDYPSATGVFDLDSIALTGVVDHLNRGVDIGGNTIDPPTELVIGVGANPVAADLPREIERFRHKVEAGAEYAITQPVFDAESLFRFLDAIEAFRLPIVAGIWPLTSYKNAEFMANEVPGVVVPPRLLERMSAARTKAAGRTLGVEIARELVGEIRSRVAGFAVSAPFGNVNLALAVLGRAEVEAV